MHVDEPLELFPVCDVKYEVRFTRLGLPSLELRRLHLLVHGQVTIIFVVSVCLSVCLCRVFLSRLQSDFDQTRTHVMCLGLVVSPRI